VGGGVHRVEAVLGVAGGLAPSAAARPMV
jgi:hypothetical protein